MAFENIPVHDLEENDFFVVETIEHCEKRSFKGIHSHNFYELLFFTSAAEGNVQCIDFVEYPILPNQICLLRRGQVHTMELRDQQGYLFAISPDYFNRLNLHMESSIDYAFPERLTLREEDVDAVRLLAGLIYREFEERRRNSLLDAYMNAFLTNLMLSYTREGPDMDKRVKSLLSWVDTYFINERSTAFYAGKIGLGSKRLNTLLKDSLGVTVTQLIHQRLLLEAKRMVSSGVLTCKEIAFELGFSDSSYFTRFFREQSGQTPEQFRSSLKKGVTEPLI